ncbi:MAG: hypothetical protein ACXWV6_10980, partial [Chitinophagaceae bacterium]
FTQTYKPVPGKILGNTKIIFHEPLLYNLTVPGSLLNVVASMPGYEATYLCGMFIITDIKAPLYPFQYKVQASFSFPGCCKDRLAFAFEGLPAA